MPQNSYKYEPAGYIQFYLDTKLMMKNNKAETNGYFNKNSTA